MGRLTVNAGRVKRGESYSVVLSVAPDREGDYVAEAADSSVDILAALDELNDNGGGTLFTRWGVYNIPSDVTMPSAEHYRILGEALPDQLATITTSGGSVFNFTDGARFIGYPGVNMKLEHMGLACSGTYADSWIDFMGISPATDQWLELERCKLKIAGIHPAGSSTNPKGTPAGTVICAGRDSGPAGVQCTWRDNQFYDIRQDDGGGTNANNTLLMIKTETFDFIDNFIYPAIGAALVTPNMICVETVSFAYFRGLSLYPASPASGGQYEHQFVSVGGNKNFVMENIQFLAAAGLSGAHFTQHGAGTLYVYGDNWMQGEGGTTPILVSGAITNGGVIQFRPWGRGYQIEGQAEVSNGDTIAHDLLAAPSSIQLTVMENDANYFVQGTVDASDITVLLYDHTAGAAEAVDKTIGYRAIYNWTVS